MNFNERKQFEDGITREVRDLAIYLMALDLVRELKVIGSSE
jgi:hypothetical protein